jgi:hypothetical protein
MLVVHMLAMIAIVESFVGGGRASVKYQQDLLILDLEPDDER